MSIFFDFEVGPSGRRFRRAVVEDKSDVELFVDREYREQLFGEVDVGSLMWVPIFHKLVENVFLYSNLH